MRGQFTLCWIVGLGGRMLLGYDELKRLDWTDAELQRRKKSDPAKLALTVQLRRETTMTMKWIAARLHLGTVQGARVRVHALTRAKSDEKIKHNIV